MFGITSTVNRPVNRHGDCHMLINTTKLFVETHVRREKEASLCSSHFIPATTLNNEKNPRLITDLHRKLISEYVKELRSLEVLF